MAPEPDVCMTGAHTLHLTNAWHAESGGIRTFYTAMLEHADRARRRVTVVVPGAENSRATVGEFGRLYTIAARPSPVLDKRYRAILPHQFLTRASPVQRIVADEKPDLVEVCDKYSLFHLAGLIKRRAGRRPTLVGLSQERFDDALRAHVTTHGPVEAIARSYLAKVYMRQFDAHLANSVYTADELLSAARRDGPANHRLWRQKDRIHLMRMGTDVRLFDPRHRSDALRADLVTRAGGSPGSALVVVAQRLSKEKHAQWIVPTVAAVRARGRDVVLAVAGDGVMRAELEQAAARAIGPRVVWLGHVTRREALAAILASADVFLHPNPREPFGLGPLEAMASGVPVVLPRAGGVLSYATDANSWLAPADPEGLAGQVAAALAHPDHARRRAAEALDTAHALDWPMAIDKIYATYDTIHDERLAREKFDVRTQK